MGEVVPYTNWGAKKPHVPCYRIYSSPCEMSFTRDTLSLPWSYCWTNKVAGAAKKWWRKGNGVCYSAGIVACNKVQVALDALSSSVVTAVCACQHVAGHRLQKCRTKLSKLCLTCRVVTTIFTLAFRLNWTWNSRTNGLVCLFSVAVVKKTTFVYVLAYLP